MRIKAEALPWALKPTFGRCAVPCTPKLWPGFAVIENADGRTTEGNRKRVAMAAITAEELTASAAAHAALKRDDTASLRALLEAGRVTPNTYVVEEQATLLYVAIRLDKPRAVALFMEFGARDAMPDTVILQKRGDTYSGYARKLEEYGKAPRQPGQPPFERRSPELMGLMDRLAERP